MRPPSDPSPRARGLVLAVVALHLALAFTLAFVPAQARAQTRRPVVASAAQLLPMMRQHGVAMWILVNEEFHDDPLVHFVAPPRPYTGNRDLFVFVDAGAEGLKKYAVTGYTEENLARFFVNVQ